MLGFDSGFAPGREGGTVEVMGPSSTIRRNRALLILAGTLGCLSASANAQLSPSQVLVVYDSRIAASRDVAEYYAGSSSVPGGAGNLPGVRAGVRVLDLASTGALVTTGPDITHADYNIKLREPLRTHLASSGRAGTIRCIVLTKGLPHRISDSDNAPVGDNPAGTVTEWEASDATQASVDSEMTLLWQDLSAGEAGGASDSKSDGMVLNPYWKSSLPIGMYATTNIRGAKSFTALGTPGPLWTTPTAALNVRLSPGDMYLVARLDGNSVADVRGMIDRAQGLVVNVNNVALLFDEDGQNFDNANAPYSQINAGNDFEETRTLLAADARFANVVSPTVPSTGINYNAAAGAGSFYVGPRLAWDAGQGILVPQNVLLVASFGANHSGVPTRNGGVGGGTTYATSYNFANGAIFNTYESYNGRAFGGLGQNVFAAQQQSADFIAAGGTFAVGHVWEPFAQTIADNEYLAPNFITGGLSWGEAAWSAIPVLSWQSIVLGDPLARMSRSVEDVDASGRVGVDDLCAWELLAPSAPARDLNRSGTGDATDRAMLIRMLRAQERADLVGGRF